MTSIKVESGNTVYDSRDNCNAIIETATNTLLSGCNKTKIPNSVTSIGKGAFSGCSDLTSISIPNSVTSIGEGAFSGCSDLSSVEIEDGDTVLKFESYSSYNPFNGCPVEKLYLGRNFSGASPFGYNKKLTTLTIGNSVTSIVTSIGKGAFSGCSGLTSVNIPNSVTLIDEQAFQGCSGLKSVKIEDGKTVLKIKSSYNYCPFTGCPVEKLYLGRNISYDYDYSPFGYNKKLTTLTIGNSVTSIEQYAFYGCSGLTSIHCLAKTPPGTSEYYEICDFFSNDMYKTATVYVPSGSYSAYINTEPWCFFNNIVEE